MSDRQHCIFRPISHVRCRRCRILISKFGLGVSRKAELKLESRTDCGVEFSPKVNWRLYRRGMFIRALRYMGSVFFFRMGKYVSWSPVLELEAVVVFFSSARSHLFIFFSFLFFYAVMHTSAA